MLKRNLKMLNKTYITLCIFLFSCFNTNSNFNLKTVDNVDINKFMGNWYVIACIPTFLEKNTLNAIENYRLNKNNEIETTFSFHKKSINNPRKTFKSKATILDKYNNSEWEMKFWGPFKSKYLIIDLAKDYSTTIVTIPNKSYVWIMSREPKIKDRIYSNMINKLESLNFDIEKIVKVPQIW